MCLGWVESWYEVVGAHACGTRTGDYPWNQPPPPSTNGDGDGKNGGSPLHPLVTRVTSWDQVKARIEALWAAHHQEG